MPLPKFNFVPARQLHEISNTYTPAMVTLGVSKQKNGGFSYTLRFMKETIEIYDLEGKYIRLFADVEKKAIGWSIIQGRTNMEELKDLIQLKANSTGQIMVGIGKLLKSMGVSLTKIQSNLEVKKYNTTLNENEIFYIEIRKE